MRRVAVGVALVAVSGGLVAVPATAGAASSASTVVTVAHNKTWGTILTLGNGDTLYRLTADMPNMSMCSGACAQVWPPAVLAAGQTAPVGRGVSGLGTITRSGGAHQITYQGVPLYLYVGDHKAGQATGNIKDAWGQWWVVNPANPHAVPTAAKTSHSSSKSSKHPTSASSGAAY